MVNFLLVVLVLMMILLLVLVFLLFQSLNSARRDGAAQGATINLLGQQFETLRAHQETLGKTMDKNLQSGQDRINTFLTGNSKTMGDLKEQIGHLKGDSERMLQIGADLRAVQNILKAPKLRGQVGEHSLASILGNVLPMEGFSLQHTFKNGKIVDALIRLPDYTVPVDAKFPLPAFEQMLAAETEDAKIKLRRQFQTDVTKHIDKIAASYILPEEGTLDFALMYIPAENVYYETIVKYDTDRADILNYALDKKVIPVSPNLLYAYLMTIVMGLHGLQIEKQAAKIRTAMGQLSKKMSAFVGDFDVVGKHLRNAQGKYDDAGLKLNKFQTQLEQLQNQDEDV